MIDVTGICSLTDFQRNAKARLKRLRATGKASVLTVNGKAAGVLLGPEAFQRVLDDLDRLDAIDGIRDGLEDAVAGRSMSLAAFGAAMDSHRRQRKRS